MSSNEVKDIQVKAQEIQKKYQVQIDAAMKQGGNVDIMPIIHQMQVEMDQLTSAIMSQAKADQTHAAEDSSSHVFDHKISDLNLDSLAYKSDLDFFRHLPNKADYLTAIDQANKDNSQYNSRRSLLATAMRLTENVSKPFFKVVNHCRETLKFKANVEIYVVQDSLFNAAAMPMTDDRVLIYFTSALLEKFSEKELAFVLGHEMGHAMFGHTNVPINNLAQYYHLLSGRDIIKLKSWQRAAELSADRAGLLCSQDYSAACTAFFKLSSGITSDSFKFNVEDYMVQFADLEHYLKNTSSQNTNEVYSSHPLNPIRLKALSLFKDSEAYSKITGTKSSSALSNADTEAQIKGFMDIMEPNYLDDESKISASIRDFLFQCAYMIASSDGNVDETEIRQISSLIKSENAASELIKLAETDKQTIIANIQALSAKIMFELSEIQRTNIVRDLFVVATADNTITTTEIQTMYNICGVFAINPYFIEDLIRDSNVPVEQPVAQDIPQAA